MSSKMRARKAQRKKLKLGRIRAQPLRDKQATEGRRRRRRNRAQAESEKQEWLRKRAGWDLRFLRQAVRNANEPGLNNGQQWRRPVALRQRTWYKIQRPTQANSKFGSSCTVRFQTESPKSVLPNPPPPLRGTWKTQQNTTEKTRHKTDAREEKSGWMNEWMNELSGHLNSFLLSCSSLV